MATNYEAGEAAGIERGMKACRVLLDKLAAAKNDAAEWKEQHENLLAMFRDAEQRAVKAERELRAQSESTAIVAPQLDESHALAEIIECGRLSIRWLTGPEEQGERDLTDAEEELICKALRGVAPSAGVASVVAPRGHDEAKKRIEECVREIEMIADTFGYDPFEWLVDDDSSTPRSATAAIKVGEPCPCCGQDVWRKQ